MVAESYSGQVETRPDAYTPPGQWGLNQLTGQMVNVRSVPRGLASGAVCPNPACADRLEAKQGRIREWHFAHSTAACEGYRHWTVKRLLAELLAREVAAGRPYPVAVPCERKCPPRRIDLLDGIARVDLEVKPFRDNQRRPDITLFPPAGGPAFLIEVVDTHPPSQEVICLGVPVLTVSAQSDESVRRLETQGEVIPLAAYNLPCLCQDTYTEESSNSEDVAVDLPGYRPRYPDNYVYLYRLGESETAIMQFCRRSHDLIYFSLDTDCPVCG